MRRFSFVVGFVCGVAVWQLVGKFGHSMSRRPPVPAPPSEQQMSIQPPAPVPSFDPRLQKNRARPLDMFERGLVDAAVQLSLTEDNHLLLQQEMTVVSRVCDPANGSRWHVEINQHTFIVWSGTFLDGVFGEFRFYTHFVHRTTHSAMGTHMKGDHYGFKKMLPPINVTCHSNGASSVASWAVADPLWDGSYYGIAPLLMRCQMPQRHNFRQNISLTISDQGTLYSVRLQLPMCNVREGSSGPNGNGALLCTGPLFGARTEYGLTDWLNHHLAMGFNHAMIYVEPAATIATRRTSAQHGMNVTVVPWSREPASYDVLCDSMDGLECTYYTQVPAYHHCLQSAMSGGHHWAMVMDTVEFLQLGDAVPKLSDVLNQIPHNVSSVRFNEVP